jgi:hypothetical protein
MADFLFECLFKSQESFSKFSNLTCRYNIWLSAELFELPLYNIAGSFDLLLVNISSSFDLSLFNIARFDSLLYNQLKILIAAILNSGKN